MKPLVKRITFLPQNLTFTFAGEPSILEVALDRNVELNHSCGGMGSCTTCRIYVEAGAENLAARNEIEQEHAQMRGFEPHERLACQTTAIDALIVRIPDESINDEV